MEVETKELVKAVSMGAVSEMSDANILIQRHHRVFIVLGRANGQGGSDITYYLLVIYELSADI